MGIKIIPKGRPYIMLRLGIGPIYAEKGGGPCLKTEVSWYKFSGIWINTKRGCYWVHFRRKSF